MRASADKGSTRCTAARAGMRDHRRRGLDRLVVPTGVEQAGGQHPFDALRVHLQVLRVRERERRPRVPERHRGLSKSHEVVDQVVPRPAGGVVEASRLGLPKGIFEGREPREVADAQLLGAIRREQMDLHLVVTEDLGDLEPPPCGGEARRTLAAHHVHLRDDAVRARELDALALGFEDRDRSAASGEGCLAFVREPQHLDTVAQRRAEADPVARLPPTRERVGARLERICAAGRRR